MIQFINSINQNSFPISQMKCKNWPKIFYLESITCNTLSPLFHALVSIQFIHFVVAVSHHFSFARFTRSYVRCITLHAAAVDAVDHHVHIWYAAAVDAVIPFASIVVVVSPPCTYDAGQCIFSLPLLPLRTFSPSFFYCRFV